MNEKEILNKFKMQVAISNFKTELDNNHTLQKENMNKNKSIIKSIGIVVCVLASTTGIAFATKATYENIWKEPKKVENWYEQTAITEQEKGDALTEEEAKKFAKELLNKFGYTKESDNIIEEINLQNTPTSDTLIWDMKTESDISITINARNLNTYGIGNTANILKNSNIINYRSTNAKMEKVAREYCKKIGYDLSEYTNTKIESNLKNENESYIYYIHFYKEYDGIPNRSQQVSIGLIPETNELYYFEVYDTEFENNPIVITEEQAIEIAKNTDSRVGHGHEISKIKCNLDILSVNGDAYSREKDYKQYFEQSHTIDYPKEDIVYYKTERNIRKCYMVTLIYKITREEFRNSLAEAKYTYMVDCTTGEVIGGYMFYGNGTDLDITEE